MAYKVGLDAMYWKKSSKNFLDMPVWVWLHLGIITSFVFVQLYLLLRN